MVREGNVRMDVSLPEDLVYEVKGRLLRDGKLAKGGFSRAVEEALRRWVS